MKLWVALLVFSIFLFTACQDNQLTGSVVNGLGCLDLQKGIYDNPHCNLNCKTSQGCQAVQIEGKTCYQCKDTVAVTQYVSCWNGGILTQLDTNKTKFLLNQTNSSLQKFCVDDCPPGMVCGAGCACVKAPPPKITCDQIKQRTNGQPLTASKNCDRQCLPQLCKAYTIAKYGLTCYGCIPEDCPPPTLRLANCQIQCSGQCIPKLQVGSAACYACEPSDETDRTPKTPPIVEQPSGETTTPTRGQTSVDCNQYCADQGMSPNLPDYSSYLRNYLQPYTCVNGARISIRSKSYLNCKCYPNQPEVSIDSTPLICKGTPCGDVACGQSSQCSCGERCTRTVHCDWGGWNIGSQSATPIAGAKAG